MNTTSTTVGRCAAPEAACPSFWEPWFGRPAGLRGRFGGTIMARKNLPLVRLAVATLAPRSGETVLEAGFGPGAGIAELVRIVGGSGRVLGVDPSAEMLAQAWRRNARYGARLDLRLGAVEQLPFASASIDAALAVNTAHLWRDRELALAELRRVLRPEGRLAVAARRTLPGRIALSPGLPDSEIERLVAAMSANGFSVTRTDVAARGRAGVVLVGVPA